MKDTLWRWFSLPLRHVCFVWHLLRSTDYMKVSRRENETGWSFAKWRSCPTVQPFHCQLDSNVGFLKMGGPPSHHGFQYVSIQKLSDLGWFGGPMRKTPNPSCLLLPRQAMQPVRSVSFIRKKLWPAVTPWRFGVFFVWSTVHDGNSYAATFRHALGCCSWEQCWMNLLERVSQKYDRQLVELTEPFAWRKWSNIVGKAKAVTTYYNLLQPITTSEHDQKNVLDLVSPACHRNGMAYVSWICQLHRQGACHKSD